MTRVLVNASSSHEGGALTILNSYLSHNTGTSDVFYVLSPKKPEIEDNGIIWIKKHTSGIGAYLFNLFFSYYYFRYYRCEKLVSFNNLNCIFPIKNKVTYFHNFLILYGSEKKFKLLRYTLKYFNQNDEVFIFQTSFVKQQFELVLKLKVLHKICWPGIQLPENLDSINLGEATSFSKTLLVPIPNIRLEHKNFSLVIQIAERIKNVKFIIPCVKVAEVDLDNLQFVDKQNRNNFLRLVKGSDGLLMTSLIETAALPIFEAVSLSKTVYALDQPYLQGIEDDLGDIPGLVKFSNINDLEILLVQNQKQTKKNITDQFSKGDWEF